MRKLAMVLSIILFIGIGTAVAEEERRPGPPINEQFIYGTATINDIELIRQKGCVVDFDLFYEDLLFADLRGRAPMQICDALWVAAIVNTEVAVKVAYRFNPLRVRIVTIGLFELERDEED